jgi:hypothetical protein
MEKRTWIVMLFVVSCSSTFALGLSPMGTPTAGLKQGNLSTGIEYSYSKMDLKANGGRLEIDGFAGSFKLPGFDIENFQTNKVYAKLVGASRVTDKWEAFVRMGVADNNFEDMDGFRYNGDIGFAIGFGTKVTFWEQTSNLKWGGLFQMDFSKSEIDKLSGSGTVDGTSYSGTFTSEISFYEIQIAVGPTYKLMDRALIYGGPFFHLLDGDLDGKLAGTIDGLDGTAKISYDIDEESYFGGYIGAQFDISENSFINIETQFTGDAWAIMGGLGFGF